MSTPQHSSRTASRAQSPSISPLPANSILNIDPPPLFVGQGFADFKTFKDKLTDWAISAKFYTRTKKSDAKRVIVDCASPVCAFHVRAYMCARRGCVVVGTLMAEHTCTPEAMANKKRAPASKQAWIQRVLPETIDVTRDTTPTQIIEAIQKKWNHTIRYEAAQRAKSMALAGAGAGAGLIGGGGGSGGNGGGGVGVQGGVMAATRTKLHPALPPPPPPTPPQQQQHQQHQQHQQQVHLQQQQQVHQQQQQQQKQQQRQQQHRQAQQQQQNQNQNHLQGGGINPSQTISTPTPTPTQQQHHTNTITNFHHHHALPSNNLLFSPPLPAPQPSPPSATTYSPPQQPAPVPAPLAPPVPPAPPAPLAPPAPTAHPVTPPSAKRGPEYDARAIRIAITDPLLAPYARASHPWRGKSVFLRYGMLRGPTLRDLLRCIQRHLPQGRVPYYITGAISTEDVPAADEVGHSEDLEGGGETGTVVLKDDDDIEAWWWISTASPMEVQVVLDSPSDPAGDMARILGVEAVNGVGVKRPRVDVGVWEEVLDEENGGRRRRVG